MKIQTRNRGLAGTVAWLTALMVLVFMTGACGQTGTTPQENADDSPPADAPANDQGEDQVDDQGEDQADDQGDDQDDQGGGDQNDDQDDN